MIRLFEKSGFPLGLGTSRLRSVSGGLSAGAARRLLETAFDAGIRFVDTAPSYGQGQAESAIGQLAASQKDELVICSKVGYSFGRRALVINALKPILRPAAASMSTLKTLMQRSREAVRQRGAITMDITPAAIRASLEGTLRRLGRQRLDILMLHDPAVDSINEENVAQLDSLSAQGLIAHWGISTSDPAAARRGLQFESLALLQTPVDAGWVGAAGDLFERCAERGVGVIAHRVFAIGLPQTGSSAPAVERQQVVERCFEFALAQPAVQMVLCGTVSVNHLMANIRSIRHLLEPATRNAQ
jgi:aryl-alcohol dehydrogenase-like predicted oxidoreductase